MVKTKAKASDVIEEIMTFDGDSKEHPLKTLFDGSPESWPTLFSVGYAQLPDSNKFVSYVITFKGKEMIKMQVSQPDFRQVAEDEAKINFVNKFMSGQT